MHATCHSNSPHLALVLAMRANSQFTPPNTTQLHRRVVSGGVNWLQKSPDESVVVRYLAVKVRRRCCRQRRRQVDQRSTTGHSCRCGHRQQSTTPTGTCCTTWRQQRARAQRRSQIATHLARLHDINIDHGQLRYINKIVQSRPNLRTNRPCRHLSIVQLYLPGGINVHVHLIHDSLSSPNQTPNGISIESLSEPFSGIRGRYQRTDIDLCIYIPTRGVYPRGVRRTISHIF